MEQHEARRILGVGHDADGDAVRAAYPGLLLRTHPDVSGAVDATQRTIELTRAFQLLSTAPPDATDTAPDRTTPEPPTPEPTAPEGTPPEVEPLDVELVDDDTIAIGAPANETLLLLIEAAHRLGEISYLDPSAGLLEVVVEFIEAPTSSVLLAMQGRATGVTDVFCTVEPLSGGEAPPADAVTRLLWRTLVEMVGVPT